MDYLATPISKMERKTLSEKTCLITGGGGGLGKEISKQLLEKGAMVVICDINKDLLDTAAKELSSRGTLLTIQCDITSPQSVESMFEQIVKEYGKLDVLINNAGIMDRFDPAGDLEKHLWDKVLAVNLTAPYLLTRLAVRHFLGRSATDAAIVNIGSLSSQGGFFAGAAYTTSKHGLLGLSQNTAAFYRNKGIRCNLIMPSGMSTNIVTAFIQGVNQEGQEMALKSAQAVQAPILATEDVAKLAVFLSSEDSSALSGACITADQGFTSLY